MAQKRICHIRSADLILSQRIVIEVPDNYIDFVRIVWKVHDCIRPEKSRKLAIHWCLADHDRASGSSFKIPIANFDLAATDVRQVDFTRINDNEPAPLCDIPQ